MYVKYFFFQKYVSIFLCGKEIFFLIVYIVRIQGYYVAIAKIKYVYNRLKTHDPFAVGVNQNIFFLIWNIKLIYGFLKSIVDFITRYTKFTFVSFRSLSFYCISGRHFLILKNTVCFLRNSTKWKSNSSYCVFI